jgi:hypothetical protein
MAILSYQGHVLMEDRSGLVVSAVVTHADGKGERAAALAMLDAMPHVRAKSVGADKAHDQPDFVRALRERGIAPHVASNVTNICGTSIDGRTTRHQTYRASQMIVRKREEHFGWGKTIGRIRQTLYRLDPAGRSTLKADDDSQQCDGAAKGSEEVVSSPIRSAPNQNSSHEPARGPVFQQPVRPIQARMNPLPGFDARQRVTGDVP